MGSALVDLAIEQSSAIHAGEPVPGSFSAADVRGATREAGMTDEGHALYLAALDRLGVSGGVERMQLAFALRDSPAEDEETLTEDEMARRVGEWWGDGAVADAKLAHAEAAWQALTRAERLALNPRRGNLALMEALAKLGKRLAGARRGPR